jgi:hypothetical protein
VESVELVAAVLETVELDDTTLEAVELIEVVVEAAELDGAALEVFELVMTALGAVELEGIALDNVELVAAALELEELEGTAGTVELLPITLDTVEVENAAPKVVELIGAAVDVVVVVDTALETLGLLVGAELEMVDTPELLVVNPTLDAVLAELEAAALELAGLVLAALELPIGAELDTDAVLKVKLDVNGAPLVVDNGAVVELPPVDVGPCATELPIVLEIGKVLLMVLSPVDVENVSPVELVDTP